MYRSGRVRSLAKAGKGCYQSDVPVDHRFPANVVATLKCCGSENAKRRVGFGHEPLLVPQTSP
jgi:hypothetical protein